MSEIASLRAQVGWLTRWMKAAEDMRQDHCRDYWDGYRNAIGEMRDRLRNRVARLTSKGGKRCARSP
jgi:hypothetical protein